MFIYYTMFCTLISLYFIVTLSWCIVVMYTNNYLLVGLPIIWFCVHYYFHQKSLNHLSQHYTYPKLSSIYEIYQQFDEGDIVFSKDYAVSDQIIQYFNDGMAHSGLVIIENGVKYLIHSNPHTNYTKDVILKTYYFFNSTWTLVKEPLLDYILKYKLIYHIYRPKIPTPINLAKVFPNKFTYCTQIIGDILFNAKLIEKSSHSLTPYVPEDLIQLLKKSGYKFFFFKQV